MRLEDRSSLELIAAASAAPDLVFVTGDTPQEHHQRLLDEGLVARVEGPVLVMTEKGLDLLDR